MSLTPEQEKIKANWIKDLTSGKYVQSTGRMYNSTESCGLNPQNAGFCCLGVLQHRLLKGKIENEWDPSEMDDGDWVTAEGHAMQGTQPPALYPSKVFYDAFDLDWVKRNQAELADKNDNGYSFSDIAEFIKREWV